MATDEQIFAVCEAMAEEEWLPDWDLATGYSSTEKRDRCPTCGQFIDSDQLYARADAMRTVRGFLEKAGL